SRARVEALGAERQAEAVARGVDGGRHPRVRGARLDVERVVVVGDGRGDRAHRWRLVPTTRNEHTETQGKASHVCGNTTARPAAAAVSARATGPRPAPRRRLSAASRA